VAALHRALSEAGDLYVADGHHRSAAASRVHAARRDQDGSHDAFLAVVFPMDDVHVMAYNRVVADLAGLSVEEFLVALDEAGFDLAPATGAVTPGRTHEFGVHIDGDWLVARARDVD
jgi:uncharacterized protein (DUF1015 family)